MRIHCEKCGESIPAGEACVWEEYPRTYLCPECYAEEQNYEVEPDDENYEKVKHLVLPEETLDFGIFGNCNL